MMIWAGGFVLAVLIYAVGPDRFMDFCANLFDAIDSAFRTLAFTLGAQAYSVVRALTIALYVVFAILSFLSSQRGHRGFWSFVFVTLLLLGLVWRPYFGSAPISHWFAALCVVVIGAGMISQRLTGPPPGPGMPFPPGGRMP
jgi:hypothetical protein